MRLPAPSTKACRYGVLALVAAVLFFIAIDGNIYASTLRVPHFARNQLSPLLHSLPLPVKMFMRGALEDAGWRPRFLVRKAYSIAAFTVIGLLTALVRRERARTVQLRSAVLWTSLLSIFIEVVQRFTGSTESLRSNVLDVLCGTLGGALGALLPTLAYVFQKSVRLSQRSHLLHDSLLGRRR